MAFVVEGATLIAEALSAGWKIEAEYVSPDHDPVSMGSWFRLAPGVLERVSSTQSPQGNLAVVGIPDTRIDLETLTFVVVADRISDPGNLGTLIRSAEAAGADAVVLTPDSVDPFNPKVVRATAGAVFHVPIVNAELADLRGAGFRLIGSSSHLGIPHTEMDWSGQIAILLGNEAHGLAVDLDAGTEDDDASDGAGLITDWVKIEHQGRAESLNVAMAGTVLCFEAARQRH
jgi:TrmH family RNA methyltransferase